jgi:glutathione S-transferase
MIELYQFELSQFSEKVRLILDYKGLTYRKIEVVPGVGQIDVFRLTGQRQLPVLKDGNIAIADSTEIAMYLDRTYPERPLLPTNPLERANCLLLEQWADSVIGTTGRKVFVDGLKNLNLRSSILPDETPAPIKNLVSLIPSEAIDVLGLSVGLTPDSVKSAKQEIKRGLESICTILAERPYLIGSTPTLADFALAGLSLVLKIPDGNYLDIPARLKGKGVPGFADNPDYDLFFNWRDKLYQDFRNPHQPTNNSGAAPTTPTTIAIE